MRNIVDRFRNEVHDLDASIMHRNRVYEIDLFYSTSSQLQRWASAMQEQFPALIRLKLDFNRYYSPTVPALALPDGFLGGSAPLLQSLEFRSIPFPALPKLLLSATDLVHLYLWNIPHSGYISPKALVTGLAVLANLRSLIIEFESPLSLPDRESRRPPPSSRTVLPALTHFEFKGVSEYLEDLIAPIDVPLLDTISITFFHQLIFDIPQLAQFMRRATKFQALYKARVVFGDHDVQVVSLPQKRNVVDRSTLKILSRTVDWQLSSMAQVFTSFIPSIDRVEHLHISGPPSLPSRWKDDIENTQWLEIFHPFTAVKSLYVSKDLVDSIAPALLELVGERVMDVLPTLESLFLEDLQPSGPASVQEVIGQFVAARQLLGHPVAVSRWNRK
jgi:hypothetical protein